MAYDEQDLFADPFDERKAHSSRLPNEIKISNSSLKPTPVFEAYWNFAANRQTIFFQRLSGSNRPNSMIDPVIATFRFTNSYRASDRVSQYLIRNVIWDNPQQWSDDDQFFRTMFFKLFNRIETWEALESEVGEVSWRNYDFTTFESVLADRQKSGVRNYSAAYIMPSAGSVFGYRAKHANHLRLLEWMIAEGYPKRIQRCRSMAEAFALMIAAPSIGPFLAYQFVTDLNYGPLTSFSEMEFVKAGPGALDGISKCFVSTEGVPAEDIILHMAHNQCRYFEMFGIDFPDLWGRPLQLIDCQNLFCEISKYSRVAFPEIVGSAGRTRIKQKYLPAGRLPKPFYPPDWKINEKIIDY